MKNCQTTNSFITRLNIYKGILLLCLCFFVGVETVSAEEHRYPVPSDYPATEIFKGIPAKVDLNSDDQAHSFRTRLRQGAKEGPNFAGHYTLVFWGCGSSCQMFAVVDAKTGKVRFPYEIMPMFFLGDPDQDAPVEEYDFNFSLDSKLVSMHGEPNGQKAPGSYYYVFEDDEFKLIDSYVWKYEY